MEQAIRSVQSFFKRKDVVISAHRYGIDAMGAMAQGLFASLLIGTIIKTLGQQLGLAFLVTAGGYAAAVAGPAMAASIGYALHAPQLVLFSLIAVGGAANELGGAGGPLAVYLIAIIAAEVGKLVSKETKIDILVTPAVTILVGVGLSALFAPSIGAVASAVGSLIMWATELQPLLMGIVVSVLVGMALTLPISSAAICAALGLTGLAGGAAVVGVLASLLSIVVGLVLGFVLLVLLNPGAAVGGMKAMLATGFSNMDKLGKVLYQAAPLMMCGLSVGFAFKTGLFNIGASGQYTMGAFFSLLCAIQFQLPWYVCLLAGAVGGAIWGVFPGLFKAYFNVNEVITAIMFNWIGMYLVNLLLANMPNMLASGWGASNSDRTAALNVANPGAILPRGPFAALFGNSSWINISIIITIIFAILVWVILQKTTFGYELKACGLSRDAAQYAGINSKRNIVLSMVISGALSGIGGAIYYLAGTGQYVLEKSILGMGFNGIPVALLASSNPIGTIFASLFISYIQVGGAAMQPAYSSETIDIVIAVIIYLAAFALLMRGIITKAVSGHKGKEGAAK